MVAVVARAPSATLAPVTTTSTAARTKGPGQEQGRTRQRRTVRPCPPRALQGSHSRSFTANHGQSKQLLDGFALAMSCSSQAHDQLQVPPADLRSGMAKAEPGGG